MIAIQKTRNWIKGVKVGVTGIKLTVKVVK